MSRFSTSAAAKTLLRTQVRLAVAEPTPVAAAAPANATLDASQHPLARLHAAIEACRGADPSLSRTARLIGGSRTKVAKKLCEEAAEVALEAVKGKRGEVVTESADLLYHLVGLWAA